MTHFKKLYPSPFISAADLDGKDARVTIERIKEKEIVDQRTKDTKPILYFKECEKGLATNITNATTIASIHGKDYEGWLGKKITLYPTQCKAKGGEIVDCVRVKRANEFPRHRAGQIKTEVRDKS